MRTSLFGVLVIAVMALVITGCPKGSRKIFGGGVPKAQGDHYDVGMGWNIGIGEALVESDRMLGPDIISPADFDRISVMSAGTVRFGRRLSPSEQQLGGLVAFAASTVRVFRFEVAEVFKTKYLKRIEAVESIDKSNYDKGYVLFEFRITQPGMYGLVNGSDMLYFRK